LAESDDEYFERTFETNNPVLVRERLRKYSYLGNKTVRTFIDNMLKSSRILNKINIVTDYHRRKNCVCITTSNIYCVAADKKSKGLVELLHHCSSTFEKVNVVLDHSSYDREIADRIAIIESSKDSPDMIHHKFTLLVDDKP